MATGLLNTSSNYAPRADALAAAQIRRYATGEPLQCVIADEGARV